MPETITSFHSGSVRLEGTLETPPDRAGIVALLIGGSGPIDRDSNMKRQPLAIMSQLAEALCRRGVASYRYDKRGVGASGGDYLSTGFFDNVDDARAALAHVRALPDLAGARVFLIGHSEGALIASAVAAGDDSLGGVVLLAGAAKTGDQTLRWQAAQVADTLPRGVRLLLGLLRKDVITEQDKQLRRIAGTGDDVIRVQGRRLNARWFREFMSFDPADSLRRIAIPTLAITGAKDIQVDPEDVAAIGALVSGPFTGEVFPDLTHLLRSDPGSPSLSAYKKLMRRPIDGRLADRMATWMRDAVLGTSNGVTDDRG